MQLLFYCCLCDVVGPFNLMIMILQDCRQSVQQYYLQGQWGCRGTSITPYCRQGVKLRWIRGILQLRKAQSHDVGIAMYMCRFCEFIWLYINVPARLMFHLIVSQSESHGITTALVCELEHHFNVLSHLSSVRMQYYWLSTTSSLAEAQKILFERLKIEGKTKIAFMKNKILRFFIYAGIQNNVTMGKRSLAYSTIIVLLTKKYSC